ncbi:hypothetical protein DRN94_001390 [archaeon]|nr:hypothetical protein [archaeon]
MSLEGLTRNLALVEELGPNERLAELVALADRPLPTIFSVLSEAGANIRFSSVSREATGLYLHLFFLETSDLTVPLGDLEQRVRGLEGVVDVKLVEPKPLPADTLLFPLQSSHMRLVVFPLREIHAIWDTYEELMAQGFAIVSYNAGKKVGKDIAMWLKVKYKLEPKDMIIALEQYMRAFGMGVPEFKEVDLDTGRAVILLKDSFESAKRRKPRPSCNFIKGLFAGFLSELVGREITVTETRCVSIGDEYCEFKARVLF